MDVLQEELRRIALGIRVLDCGIARLSDPHDDPDYQAMLDVAIYLTHYPAHYTHPFAVALHDACRGDDPAGEETHAALLAAHTTHETLGEALIELLEGACAGHLVPRDKLLEKGAAFAVVLRETLQPLHQEIAAGAAAKLSAEALRRLDEARRVTAWAEDRAEWDARHEALDTAAVQH